MYFNRPRGHGELMKFSYCSIHPGGKHLSLTTASAAPAEPAAFIIAVSIHVFHLLVVPLLFGFAFHSIQAHSCPAVSRVARPVG